MNKTQTNIDKVQKPAAATAAKAPAATTAPAAKPVAPTNKKKRKKIRFKPNKGGMLALLALVLITAVIVTAVVFIAKGIIHAVNNPKETTESTSGNTDKPTIPWNNAYASILYPNSEITKGKEDSSLILVNSANSYSHADSIKSQQTTNLYQYNGYSSYYVLLNSDTRVHNSMLSSLVNMISALVEADPNGTFKTTSDKIIITGAYRDIAQQTNLNSNYPSIHPEAPGYSEHHTGLAVDLKVLSNSATIALRDSEYEWLAAHCAEYGFIIRYEASKSALTGIVDEPYHFRYVGVSHATYMTANNLCLEEYLELLRTSHCYDKTPLEITVGDQEYLVYYVAADTTDGASFTSIPVPPASEGTYTISGDNMNGFIVTVTKAK
jgi:D-alanyl-D-alanine carboxypeptidase